ncbi:SH3 domain-containing protein [Clostridium perfringens]|uniref:SH3 domain-containing protein n=1 Tax=Clostridium perfringens TaxID=1502 RepID=UPI0022E122EE|nr:SH3 domain-containing protein [Clostridium perfringens]MDK0768056.1 SH3 domain-containing protein [Clostridium perfringens]MDK0770702.1 SH3 domain-containing protein [Clostridium perfringens]MDK0775727.1 SH3 domain-containing protein [Clostridium perfringens]MDM0529769.1 SH3 domain-containing protein [Clostridium perfringens]
MAVAIVQQHQQQPNDKINIDLSNSNIAVVKNTKPPIKNEKESKDKDNLKSDKKTEPKVEEKKQDKGNSKEENKAQVKTEPKVKEDKDTKKSSEEIKEEVKNQKPVIKEVKLPVEKDSKNSSENLSNNSSDFASDVNRRLYEYESVRSNQSNAMNEAIRLHNGDPSNTCVFFQGACLRAIGVPVPSHIGYTSNLWNWLENNNWEMHRDFSNIQKGDIIFAGEYHTMCFMGWKDKANGIAYVMGNEAYSYGDAYAHRNLNGQAPTKENGWNRQYRATRYYKYKGNSSKSNSDIVKTNIVTSKPISSKDHKYTVEALKGTVTAKQDVYINEKPFPTTEGIKPVGLANGGDKLTVTGRASNGWYEVLYNGQKAYISHRYTNFLEEKESTSKSSDSVTPLGVVKTNTSDKKSDSKEDNKKIESSLKDKDEKVKKEDKSTEDKKVDESKDKATNKVESNKTKQAKPLESSKPVEETKKEESSKPSEIVTKTAFIKANGGLWLHSSKDTSYSSRVSLMSNGAKVNVLEEDNSWFKVDYNGNTGWCSSKYVTNPVSSHSSTNKKVEKNKSTEPKKTMEENKPKKESETSKPALTIVKTASVKANGGLWLHSTKDSYASSRITIMSNGEKVDILDESGSWYKVNYNGTMGWCSSQFLSNPTVISQSSQSKTVEENKPVYENKTVEVSKPVNSTVKTAYIKANGGLWLHSSKNSYASSRISIMNKGSKVRVLEESGSWFKVDHNGNIGWCSSEFLTNPVTSKSNTVEESKPVHLVQSNTNETSLRSAHVKANGGLWLHSSKDSSTSSRLTVMGNGHNVEILEESGDWVKVRYNGNIGWCAKEFIA